MAYTPLTPDQFKAAKGAGFSTDKIIEMEQRRKSDGVTTTATAERTTPIDGGQKTYGSTEGALADMVRAPIKSLIVKPLVRTAQALVAAPTYAFGSEAAKRRMDEELASEKKVGGYTIEAPKTNLVSGAKQIAGEGLEAASYLYGGGGAAKAGTEAIKNTLGTAIRTGAKAGAISGAMSGGGLALEADKGVVESAGQAIKGAVIGGGVGAALPIAVAGIGKGISKVVSIPGEKAAKTADEVALLESRIPDASVATKSLNEAGDVVTDKAAKEVVRQGIPEADVALMKSGSVNDKRKMLDMLEKRAGQMTNKRTGIVERATDVVGNTFLQKVAKPVDELNKRAAARLNIVAQGLAGKKVDVSPAVEALANEFDSVGISVRKNGTLNFGKSAFEGRQLTSIQSALSDVWRRAMKAAKTGDALQLHRTKMYIDNIVKYGAEGQGLSGKASSMLKSFRHNIDGILDTNFPQYDKVNTVFKDTIEQLNAMGLAMGKRFRIGDSFADARAGVAMRKIMSNSQSRADVLKLIDGMQKVAQKYGVKLDEDVITQAGFADTLEKMFGSEAPTSFLGQSERAMSQLGQAGADVAQGTPVSMVKGVIKAGKYAIDVTRGVSEKNKMEALKALLKREAAGSVTNFGKR